jgi:iron complex outermembrane receptor protein
LRVEAGINDYRHTEFEPGGEPGTRFENDAWESRIELVHDLGDWQGVAGAQYLDRDFEAVGEEAFVPQTDTRSLGLFLLEEKRYDELRFSISARYETMEHNPSIPADNYDEDAGSLAVGFVWDNGQKLLPSLSLSYTERHPKTEELYSDGPHLATGLFEIGDPSLNKESNKSVDLGLRYRGERIRWGASVFYKAAGDYIYLRNTGAEEDDLPVAVYTQDDAIFYGYEAELETHLAQTAQGDLDLRLWSDFVRGQLDERRDGSDDLPRMPPQRFGAELGWLANRWSASVEWTRYMKQSKVADFERTTGAYTMLNAGFLVGVDFGPGHLDLFLRGTNLLDEPARRHPSFLKDYAPLPGRSVHAGARFHFL